MLALVRELNRLYREEPALHERDHDPAGFSWIVPDDADSGITAFLRRGHGPGGEVLVLLNYTPVVREGYEVGVPRGGRWRELLNSDAEHFWGSGVGNLGHVVATSEPRDGQPCTLRVTVPPLGALLFRADDGEG